MIDFEMHHDDSFKIVLKSKQIKKKSVFNELRKIILEDSDLNISVVLRTLKLIKEIFESILQQLSCTQNKIFLLF